MHRELKATRNRSLVAYLRAICQWEDNAIDNSLEDTPRRDNKKIATEFIEIQKAFVFNGPASCNEPQYLPLNPILSNLT